MPIKKTINAGDELYKIVPKGSVPGKSSFYMTKQELNLVENASDLEQKLGLPLSSHSAEYDVFKATANQSVDVFESSVAPTEQGLYKTTGGAKQTFILDIDKWTVSKMKTIVPAH